MEAILESRTRPENGTKGGLVVMSTVGGTDTGTVGGAETSAEGGTDFCIVPGFEED